MPCHPIGGPAMEPDGVRAENLQPSLPVDFEVECRGGGERDGEALRAFDPAVLNSKNIGQDPGRPPRPRIFGQPFTAVPIKRCDLLHQLVDDGLGAGAAGLVDLSFVDPLRKAALLTSRAQVDSGGRRRRSGVTDLEEDARRLGERTLEFPFERRPRDIA
jgi:hypothetical protein